MPAYPKSHAALMEHDRLYLKYTAADMGTMTREEITALLADLEAAEVAFGEAYQEELGLPLDASPVRPGSPSGYFRRAGRARVEDWHSSQE